MYNNAAGKLMTLIKIITSIMMCLVAVVGLVLWRVLDSPFLGILVAAIGCVFVWLSNLVIATFAQIGVDVHTLVSGQETINAGERWICDNCGQANVEGVGTCQACGVTRAWLEARRKKSPDASKPVTCPQCGAALRPGDVFCTQCGTKINR